MKKLFPLAAAMAVLVVAQGCATGLSKSEYTVDVLSDPPNKHFKIYNRKGEYVHQGTTPMIVALKSQSDYFKNEVYKIKTDDGKTSVMTATLTPIYWGNFFGFVGFAVDGLTGAMWALPSKHNLDKPENKEDVMDRL
jgi:hypothetical protein